MIGDRLPRVIATTDRTLQGWHRGGSSRDADFPGLLGPPSEKGMRRRGKAKDPLLFFALPRRRDVGRQASFPEPLPIANSLVGEIFLGRPLQKRHFFGRPGQGGYREEVIR